MNKVMKNKNGLSKMVIILVLGIIVIIIGSVLFTLFSGSVALPKSRTLTMWGVFDDSSDLEQIINSYQALHPYIKINYSKIRYEEYEDYLLRGWATNTGPDIFAIPNSWVTKYSTDFIAPMPPSTKIAYYTTKKVLFKKETKIEVKQETSLDPSAIKRNFIDVVYDDVIINDSILALPLSINTLVVYYNRELLNQAHLVQPPRTWNEFSTTVSRIATVDEQNNIIKAATALGTYENIPRAADIVTLLMLQNGTQMTTSNKSKNNVTFNRPSAGDPTYFPGIEALRFYTDFAAPEKSVYTWNNQMPNALDFFAAGNLTFFLGYKYQESEIQAKSQGLDYEIAPIPQVNPDNEINYANYWVYTVAKKSSHTNDAWNFLQYAASESVVNSYLEATKQTSVLRSILNAQLADPEKSILAQQALTAKSWYHGKSPQKAEEHFSEMIKNIVNNKSTISSAIDIAANQIDEEY